MSYSKVGRCLSHRRDVAITVRMSATAFTRNEETNNNFLLISNPLIPIEFQISTNFASQMIWNNREVITETRSYIFRSRPRCRHCLGSCFSTSFSSFWFVSRFVFRIKWFTFGSSGFVFQLAFRFVWFTLRLVSVRLSTIYGIIREFSDAVDRPQLGIKF